MSRTKTYAVVTPYDLYRCVLIRDWWVANVEKDFNYPGIMLRLSSIIYEDDYVMMENCDAQRKYTS